MTDWSFSQEFYSKFQISRSDLAEQIESAKAAPSLSTDALQTLSLNLAKLTRTLVDATGSLPAYDQRQSELQLKALEKTLDDLRSSSSASTSKKFAFKRKAGKPLASIPDIPTAKDPDVPSHPTATSSTNLALSSHTHRYLTIDSLPTSLLSSHAPHLTISDLDSCIVNLLPPLESTSCVGISSLHVRNITNTVLLLPIIGSSVLLHDVRTCIIAAGCHQFRMHNSRDVDVYLAIPSNPIIEHSSNIRFTRYPEALLTQSNNEQHHQAVKVSNHLSVQDFSHIRSTASPNWSILADEKRSDTWPTSSIKDCKELDGVLLKLLPA